MKIVDEKSGEKQERRSLSAERQEFLESVEDHQGNDESPEDHCSERESRTSPLRQHAKLFRAASRL
jgi:hypothetical protein